MMRKEVVLIVFILIWCKTVMSSQEGVVRIEDKRQLFVDNYLIDKCEKTELRLNIPCRKASVIYYDKPWEGRYSFYTTVIKDKNIYRGYYRGREEGTNRYVTCYAESLDGILWNKPNLGIHYVSGTYDNNVILKETGSVSGNFSPFLDSITPNQDERYKALGGNNQDGGLLAYVSRDGIHWEKLQKEPVIQGDYIFDSQNVSFWSESEQMYVCYFRSWTGEPKRKPNIDTDIRSVSRTTSNDFINWTEPVKMSFGNIPLENIYIQQTSPYFRAPDIYIAIGARFMPKKNVIPKNKLNSLEIDSKFLHETSDAIFMTSRGGNQYDRTFMESFIRPSIGWENWVSRTNYPALNVVKTSDTEMSIYVNEHYAQPSANLRRYTMRIDGFSSLSANYEGGEMVTKPLVFKGKELEINYSTSAAGLVKIELQDINGKPIPGYSMKDCQEIIGNEIERIVSWGNGVDVSDWSGKAVRLCIYLKDADLYSIKFNE